MAEGQLQRESRVGNVAGDAMHRDVGSSPSQNSLSLGASRGPREVAQWNVSERLAIKGPAGSGKKKSMESIVFHQCTYGADYPKPAKFLSEADGFLQLGFSGREDLA